MAGAGDYPPPPAPVETVECPASYTKHLSACYKYGSHLSYNAAKSACEADGAKLAGVDQINTKYLRSKVDEWGGNDFFVGSFLDRGRVVGKKGSAACPIIKGQNLGGVFGTVDCNSANRYICQFGDTKPMMNTYSNPYGMQPGPGFGGSPAFGDPAFVGNSLQPFPFSSTIATSTEPDVEEASDNKPVIYAVVSIVVIILLLIALRLLFKRYRSGSKGNSNPFKRNKNEKKAMAQIVEAGGGEKLNEIQKFDSQGHKLVFSANKGRPATADKNKLQHSESGDSACPPSYISAVENDKPMPLPQISFQAGVGRPLQSDVRPSRMISQIEEKKKRLKSDIMEEVNEREGRTREKENASKQRSKSAYRKDEDRSPKRSRHKHTRRNSDPMSEVAYDRRYGRHRSTTESSEESSEDSYQRGPKRVYQKGQTRSRRHRGESGHYGSRHSAHDREYGSHRRRHRSRRHKHSKHYGHYGESRHHYGGYNSLGNHRSRREMHSHVNPSFTNDSHTKYSEGQYFPQPAKLMSMIETQMKNENKIVEQPYRMAAMEPIRVNRQIYEHYNFNNEAIIASKSTSKSKPTDENNGHFYESLDETKNKPTNYQVDKSGGRRAKKKSTPSDFKHLRMKRTKSGVSVASVQSRKLPRPPKLANQY